MKNILQKTILVLILCMFFYILFRLLKKRFEIMQETYEIEGFTSFTNKNVIAIESANKLPLGLTRVSPANQKKTLDSFVIKSSFDSAYDGETVSTDMVTYVLSRGYRFLDFEVFYALPTPKEGETPSNVPKAVVGCSTQGAYPSSSSNAVLFSEILDTIVRNAFKNPVPNLEDPLFIQIRPMYQLFSVNDSEETKLSKRGKNGALNREIEQALDTLKPVRYNGGAVTPKTTLEKIMGKVVIIMDKNSNGMNQKTGALSSKIHIDPYTKGMQIIDYGKLPAPSSSEQMITEVVPFDSKHILLTNNVDVLKTVQDRVPFNILPMMAWMSSYLNGTQSLGVSNLGAYEMTFNDAGGSSFLLMPELNSYAASNGPTINIDRISV
jgi:hypothetical protein